jgi:FMN phosphatase YigB (HAD superfamily)
LVRACGGPQMVFPLIAGRLSNEKAFIVDFVKRRIQAEADACFHLKKEAVTIDEIYDYFDLASLSLHKSQIIDLEMSVEEQLLYPVYPVLEQINGIHAAGCAVWYISDMYLPASFLEKILTRWGFWKNGDRLFVSGEYGLTKQTGNLYRSISEHLNIPFKNWHHYGDHPLSDVKIPRKLGIKSHRIKNDYSRYEKQWIKNVPPSFEPEISGYFAGCARVIRLSDKPDDRISLAADVIAPVYIPFVFYLFEQAKERGITHLYFTARDGYLFYTIALKLSHLFPEITLSYIYLSRRSLWLPSLFECDRSDYESCLDNITGCTPEKIMKALNISVTEIAEYAEVSPTFWQTLLTDDTAAGFYDLLLNPEIRKIIRQRSSQARALLMAYLEQEQLLENVAHAAIVDLGWYGTVRTALNKILLKEGYGAIFTYYWGVNSNRIPYSDQNPYSACLFLEDLGSFNSSYLYGIMEHYFSVTTQYSTIGYVNHNNTMAAVFDREDRCPDEVGVVAETNLKVMDRMVDLLLHFPHLKSRIPYSFVTCGLHALKTFYAHPLYREVQLIKKVPRHDLYVKSHSIVQSLNLLDLLFIILWDYPPRIVWKAGSLVAVSSWYGSFLNNVYQSISNLEQFRKLKRAVKRVLKRYTINK